MSKEERELKRRVKEIQSISTSKHNNRVEDKIGLTAVVVLFPLLFFGVHLSWWKSLLMAILLPMIATVIYVRLRVVDDYF